MSKIPGLSLISKDVEFSNNEVKFINIDNTNSDIPIFIAGIATDQYEVDETTVRTSTIDNIAHGKFSNLSLINNDLDAVEDSSVIQKGFQNYLYIDRESGQLKTNSFQNLMENNVIHINTFSVLALKDVQYQNVTLTGEELKKLKLLLN